MVRNVNAIITPGFSLGVLHGWRGVALGLLASVVFLISGRQDVSPGVGMTSSAFWFLLALASACCVAWLGVGSRIWTAALLGAAFFCLEIWLIRHWLKSAGTGVE